MEGWAFAELNGRTWNCTVTPLTKSPAAVRTAATTAWTGSASTVSVDTGIVITFSRSTLGRGSVDASLQPTAHPIAIAARMPWDQLIGDRMLA